MYEQVSNGSITQLIDTSWLIGRYRDAVTVKLFYFYACTVAIPYLPCSL